MASSLQVVMDALPFILGGTVVTVCAVAIALGMGLVFGVPLAVAQVYGGGIARRCVGLYVWFFRGVPILVLLFLFYGLFVSWGLNPNPFLISCCVMGCTSTAYQSQIFRGAIQSLPQGQLKAARALGMRDTEAIRSIILPQAMRLSIPGWANEFSILLKDSAVCYVLGTQEIMSRANAVATRTHEHLAMFAVAGIMNNNFDQIYVLQNSFNLSRSQVIDTYIYKVGLQELQFGMAAAVNIFKSVLALILLTAANFISNKLTDSGLF